jgi:outer membrane receptor protein involved in Fe transport
MTTRPLSRLPVLISVPTGLATSPNSGLICPAAWALSVNATVLDYFRTKQSPGVFDPEIEWAGSLGPNLTSLNAGAYDFRLFGNISYIRDNWSVTLRWRHLPQVDSAGMATTRASMRNNAAVAAGAPGIILNYSPITEVGIDAYNIFDLAANWTINDKLSLRAGVTNLLDVEPETSYNPGRPLRQAAQLVLRRPADWLFGAVQLRGAKRWWFQRWLL